MKDQRNPDADDGSRPALHRYAQGLIAVGAVLRIAQYAFNRSLWLDEASLAMNIVGRSFQQLTQPLSYGQGAPLAFLTIEKAMTQVLGTGEYALRLFPLVAGLLSLWIFDRVARRVLLPAAHLFGLALFATLDPLIYFSSELKQYSSDVMVALLLLWMALHVERRRFDYAALLLATGVGAAAIWFSHPAVFVLAGIGSTWFVSRLRQKQWRGALALAGVGSLWVGSFVASYEVTLSNLIVSPELQSFWSNKFVLEGSATPGLSFLIHSDLALAIPMLTGVFLLRSRDQLRSMLVLPACFAFVAAVLHMYPFTGRLILFLLPLGLLLLARATIPVAARLNGSVRNLGTVLLVATLVPFFVTSGYRLFVPRVREETRTEIEWMSRRFQSGDLCYAYYATDTSIWYYAPRFGLDATCISGVSSRENWSRYVDDLQHIPKARRVWVLFSHVHHDEHPLDERLFFLSELDRMGRRLQSHEGLGAFTYLYDLTPSPPRTSQERSDRDLQENR
jgi:hypothetical protein